MSPMESIIIGLISGVIIVYGISLIDKLKLDDPVGAVAVHLICGIWGTLTVGIFGDMASLSQILIQLFGILIIGVFCILSSFILLIIVKSICGLRVSNEEELRGLDVSEHTMEAYADFRTNQH